MTISDVRLGWSNTGGTLESQDGKKATATATEGWQVTHSADATISEILAAEGLPQIGDRFGFTYLVCKRQGAANRVGPIYTIVTITYEGEIGIDSEGRPDTQQTPLNTPPIIEWGDEASSEPIEQDWNGAPIVNVNNEPIVGVTVEVADPVLVVTKNFATYNPHIIHAYRMATNSDTFAGFQPGTARMIGTSAKLMGTVNNLYWQVTARFKFRYPYGASATADKAWYFHTKNEGFKVRANPNQTVSQATHATDDDGNKVVKPVLLTEDGTIETDTILTVFLAFQRYDSLPFNALGFGV